MKDRISQIIKRYQLSASEFAASIQVQPAVISHVLSGRNKPSLDFVMKVLREFPDISVEWLLFGKGRMNKEEKPKEVAKKETSRDTDDLFTDVPASKKDAPSVAKHREAHSRQVSRIIMLYTDGTFDSWEPSSK